MNKRIIALMAFLLIFGIAYGSYAYAGSSFFSSGSASDVSIDAVRVNGNAFAESETNFIAETNNLDVFVSLTAIKDVGNIHVDAVLTDLNTGNTVADSSNTFDLITNQSAIVALNLRLIDRLKKEKNFRLEIKVVDVKDNKEIKSYGLRFTGGKAGAGKLDVSIDRVKVNEQVVAAERTNFIEQSNDFDVLVEFTALEDLKNAHVEAVLRDLKSGDVVADSSPNFDLPIDSSSSRLLVLTLLDKLKQSSSFELTVRIVDADGNSVEKKYNLAMRGRNAVSGGRALDVSIDRVELEKESLAENENNFVIIGADKKKIELKVRLTSLENAKDAHVDAILSFENGDVIADATTSFDISKGQTLSKTLELPLISKFEQSNFKLKVRIVDADGFSEEKQYGLKVSTKNFPFVISSIALSPEANVEAGKNLIATLKFKNSGVVSLEGINAKVSIPELGISSTKFIEQIRNSNSPEVSEEFILKVLDSVQTGTYTVKSEIISQFGGESESKEIPVFVVGKNDQTPQIVNDKIVINVPISVQDIANDGSEVMYPIIFKNEGPSANAYTMLLDGRNWADLRLAESNVFVLNPKESKTINIYASAKPDASGQQVFLVSIKKDDKVLQQIQLKGNVVYGVVSSKSILVGKLKNVLELFLVIFAVFIGVVGLFFGLRRQAQGNGGDASSGIPEQAEGEAYY